MGCKYNEIHRLHGMLTGAGIEHELFDRNGQFDPDGIAAKHFRAQGLEPIDWGWQIIVYRPEREVGSAVRDYDEV